MFYIYTKFYESIFMKVCLVFFAHRLIVLNISFKFHENILDGLK